MIDPESTMHQLLFTIILTLFITAGTSAQPRWYKGNLHTHTLWSDGDDFPEMVAAWYKDRGYDFLALSDHNILSRTERWMPLKAIEQRGGMEVLPKYLERFGPKWVMGRALDEVLEVRLRTLEEVRSQLQIPGEFLLIEAEEITDDFQGLPIHINATNIQQLIEPQGGTDVREVIRRNLIAIESQAEETGNPILGHINHPNYAYAITAEDLAHVLEEKFFEVFNGHPSVNSFGDRDHVPVERMWDIANTIRIARLDAPPLYGLATDDSHNYHTPQGSIPGRGWVMVRAESLDPPSIIASLQAGDFYASTGVMLREVKYDKDAKTLTIEIEPQQGDEAAEYITQFIGTRIGFDEASEPVLDDQGVEVERITRRYSSEVGIVLAEVNGPTAIYRFRGDELYVRAMILSTRPVEFPIVEGQRRQAWTQPVGWD